MSSKVNRFQILLPLLAACGSGGSAREVGQNNAPDASTSATAPDVETGNDGGGGGASTVDSCSLLFTQRVEPRLALCRNCHSAGGVAEHGGAMFMLSSDPSQDYQNLRDSWARLGKNVVGTSPILTRASGTSGLTHSGGAPWPVGSDAYNDMSALLQGFDDPSACAASSTGPVVELALLGSKHGGNYWFDFCEGQPDGTPLPADPRTLVVPGVNMGKAVHMNGFWETCQSGDQPANCGELRQRAERGYRLVAANGEIGAGTVFGGDGTSSSFVFTATDYAKLPQALGLGTRPDDFDELLAERWGTPLSPDGNPYPLAGEDPNQTNGGSGKLPMALTQLRNTDGTWTGNISITCSVCHAGKVGDASDGPGLGPMYGTNSLSDVTVMFADLGRVAPSESALGVFALNKLRGTGNITNFQFFGVLEVTGSPSELPSLLSIQGEPSTGTEDPPVWWNLGHRSVKFFDGAQVADSKRIELSFHLPNAPLQGSPPGSTWNQSKQWIIDHQQDADAWITSLRSPKWPEAVLGSIDVRLAQEGAVLFHDKNLWDPSLHNPVPQPEGGNGSCAGCHGAYSPRYVNDTRFLDTPLLEGMAANIVPLDVIGTDSRRLDGNSPAVVKAAQEAWFAYSDGPYDQNGGHLCGNWNDAELRGSRALGYLAPPLYGVWATAPYFHNGSVPNLWEVLQPADRKPIWRRVSTTPPSGQSGQVMGFATDLGSYDAEKVGWKYEALECGNGSTPGVDCTPGGDAPDGGMQTVEEALGPILSVGLEWNLLNVPPMSDSQIEQRKIYNTNYYSQSNAGHEFTTVLTDDERRAIIEYLKTL